MNWDRVEGNWKQFKGEREGAVGQAHRRPARCHRRQARPARRQDGGTYGISKDEAEKQLAAWQGKLKVKS